jgi:hypothetical protein
MSKPLRLAVAALTQQVYIGRVNKAGDSFLDGKQDVTSDFLKAVIDRFGVGETTIRSSSGKTYIVKVISSSGGGKALTEAKQMPATCIHGYPLREHCDYVGPATPNSGGTES